MRTADRQPCLHELGAAERTIVDQRYLMGGLRTETPRTDHDQTQGALVWTKDRR